MAEQKHQARQDVPGREPGWWVAGQGRKADNKAKAQHSKDIIPSKLIAELLHSARLGKTFPGGWLAGWPAGWVGKSWEKG